MIFDSFIGDVKQTFRIIYSLFSFSKRFFQKAEKKDNVKHYPKETIISSTSLRFGAVGSMSATPSEITAVII